jgi:predicted house-cleaning NTP pyrophosphatase (Maf/HAM1 superfamily)
MDAVYGNVRTTRKSTNGFAIFLASAAIVYQSKTQTQTALSSTEAEFYEPVSAAKIIRYLRSILL